VAASRGRGAPSSARLRRGFSSSRATTVPGSLVTLWSARPDEAQRTGRGHLGKLLLPRRRCAGCFRGSPRGHRRGGASWHGSTSRTEGVPSEDPYSAPPLPPFLTRNGLAVLSARPLDVQLAGPGRRQSSSLRVLPRSIDRHPRSDVHRMCPAAKPVVSRARAASVSPKPPQVAVVQTAPDQRLRSRWFRWALHPGGALSSHDSIGIRPESHQVLLAWGLFSGRSNNPTRKTA
jgi:hypothetical protein